jgi:hypothetical protein
MTLLRYAIMDQLVPLSSSRVLPTKGIGNHPLKPTKGGPSGLKCM